VQIQGDLFVAGNIDSESLTLNQTDESNANVLSIRNTQGEEEASIDASGSARLKELVTQRVAVKDDPSATSSSNLIGGIVYESSASAGEASIPAGEVEVMIKNPNIQTSSLIYLTPTTSTKDQVLYLKEKESCNTGGLICEKFFTVGFDKPAKEEVKFNWWLIDVVAQAEGQ
jgi:hypothetical protein